MHKSHSILRERERRLIVGWSWPWVVAVEETGREMELGESAMLLLFWDWWREMKALSSSLRYSNRFGCWPSSIWSSSLACSIIIFLHTHGAILSLSLAALERLKWKAMAYFLGEAKSFEKNVKRHSVGLCEFFWLFTWTPPHHLVSIS